MLFSALTLNSRLATPLYRQLYSELRDAVLTGRLKSGSRLPSTRNLARDLGVSRNTVMEAFEQLIAEGYLEALSGAGTFVCPTRVSPRSPGVEGAVRSASSKVVARIRSLPPPAADFRLPLCPGIPAIEEFPAGIWAQLSSRCANKASRGLLNYGNPMGYGPLREAIAEYLCAARGLRCDADQVVIVNGAQQGTDLAARFLVDPGQAVWVEDPGYLPTRNVFAVAGARIVPVRVDSEGLDVKAGRRNLRKPRLICISPSHQFPLGVTMTLSRRLQLLEWARSSGAFILEDDYDSEFQYEGRAVSALQGLDEAGRVLYIGTFSKVLFPGLRLGYVVLPTSLLREFARLKAVCDFGTASLEQAILTDFIREGHLTRHVRRMRKLYLHRQNHLRRRAAELLGDRLQIQTAAIGLHVIGWLGKHADDRKVAGRLREAGFGCPPLSAYCMKQRLRPGLVIGYGNLSEQQIDRHIARLAETID